MPRTSRRPSVSDGDGQTSVLSETVIALSEVPKLLPQVQGARPVAAITIYKWIRKRVRGQRLEAARIGTRWVISVQAVSRFLKRLAQL